MSIQVISAQTAAQAVYVRSAAEMVVSFRPAWLILQADEATWQRQEWLQRAVAALQRDLWGKRTAAEIWQLLAPQGAKEAGIDFQGYWHLVSERDEVGITRYSLIAPMQSIAAWRTFVQKSLPLYVDTEMRIVHSSIFYIQREQYLLAWSRTHLRLTWYALPNEAAYNPTFVQRRQYVEESILPTLLPAQSLAQDSAWLAALRRDSVAATNAAAPVFVRLAGRLWQLSAKPQAAQHWSLLYVPRSKVDLLRYAGILRLPALTLRLPRWSGRYAAAARTALLNETTPLRVHIEANGSLRLWLDAVATTQQCLALIAQLYDDKN